MECKGMGSVHSGFYGALFNGDEEQGRLFDDLVGSIRSADEGKAKAIYLTGTPCSPSLLMLCCLRIEGLQWHEHAEPSRAGETLDL